MNHNAMSYIEMKLRTHLSKNFLYDDDLQQHLTLDVYPSGLIELVNDGGVEYWSTTESTLYNHGVSIEDLIDYIETKTNIAVRNQETFLRDPNMTAI